MATLLPSTLSTLRAHGESAPVAPRSTCATISVKPRCPTPPRKVPRCSADRASRYIFPADSEVAVDPADRKHDSITSQIQLQKRSTRRRKGSSPGVRHRARSAAVFAAHLLMKQHRYPQNPELIGRKSVETTIVYTHGSRTGSEGAAAVG